MYSAINESSTIGSDYINTAILACTLRAHCYWSALKKLGITESALKELGITESALAMTWCFWSAL